MSAGAWVLLVAIAVALAFGTYRAATDGRFRGTRRVGGARPVETSVVEPPASSVVEERASRHPEPPSMVKGPSVVELVETTGLRLDLGERATLLQFSSAFCAPCRATRRVLAEVAAAVPGVRHVEVDAEHHLEAVRRLDVLRTPTTLVLDAHGVEVTRATGAPRKEQVLAALAGVTA